ncbi:MAG: nucleotidyltransferase family protein [Kutzneria sp.]|nr:nucleotidyltransferase family protein [Kutzneria sp.]
MTTVAGLVLAAGAGRRYGMPKALVRLGGRLLVESTVDVLRAAGCTPVIVVVGAQARRVRRANLGDALITENPDWPTGMGSSLRSGLTAAAGSDATAAAVLPVDLPGMTPEAVRRVTAFADAEALVAASYHGVRGHPVLLGRAHWHGVCDLALGDSGAREYLRRHEVVEVPCEDVASGRDVDRPTDLPR